MLSLDRFAIPLLCILAGFVVGWSVNGWRLGSKLSDLRAEHQRVIAEVNAKSVAALEQAQQKAAETQAAIQSIADSKLRELNDAQAELDRIRTGIDRGDYRVYVRARCPAAPVPAASDSAGVDIGAGAELAADARQDYFDLRAGIVRTETKLAACQQSLSEAVKAR